MCIWFMSLLWSKFPPLWSHKVFNFVNNYSLIYDIFPWPTKSLVVAKIQCASNYLASFNWKIKSGNCKVSTSNVLMHFSKTKSIFLKWSQTIVLFSAMLILTEQWGILQVIIKYCPVPRNVDINRVMNKKPLFNKKRFFTSDHKKLFYAKCLY